MTTAIFSDHHRNMTTAAASIYSDHHPSSPTAKLPPRKLLVNRNNTVDFPQLDDMSSLAHFYKHLPCNKADQLEEEEEDGDPYSSDQFRMYDFKVRRCTRSRSHDWTDCPFAHPGEKARRRDPRKFHYTGAVCPEFRRGGGCSRGDNCEFAHGVFECWLHPLRYRTEACKDGKGCKRKVCFFAHSPRQLRLLPPEKSSPTSRNDGGKINHRHHSCGCLVCRGSGGDSSSPTSTLIGLSHLSPPLSPSFSSSPPVSPVSHHRPSAAGATGFSHRLSKFQSRYTSYKDVLSDLMSSLEAMNFSEEAAAAAVAAAAAAVSSSPTSGLTVNPWINEANSNSGANYGDDFNYQLDQQQFIMSPSTPPMSCGFDKYDGDIEQNGVGSGGNAAAGYDPDLGWVNELLM